MIGRYTTPEMGALWSDSSRFEHMLQVEIAVLQALADEGDVPAEAVAVIEERATVDIERIAEIEATTDHDVVAFVTQVAETVGEDGRWIHFGLTSSDVVDTGLALQCRAAADLILASLDEAIAIVVARAREHAETLQMGRTHGVHAEPLTFGLKLATWAFELDRARTRFRAAADDLATGKISGPVGTYSQLLPSIEAAALGRLGLKADDASTQVVQRDRHAAFLAAIAVAGGSLERFAVEIRNLQHTELAEVGEPFKRGQTGSSAMPHKRNPIMSERITGMARLLRGHLIASYENVALWHDRDISHSSVERVILPDAFHIAHYTLGKMKNLVLGMRVYPDAMQENLDKTRGLLFSQNVLGALLRAGMDRHRAYKLVQTSAMRVWEKEADTFRAALESDSEVQEALGAQLQATLDEAFDLNRYFTHLDALFVRAGIEA